MAKKQPNKYNKLDNQALRADVFQQFRGIKRMQREERAVAKGVDPSDAALYELSATDGWPILRDFILDMKEQMRDLIAQSMEQGADFEDIGKLTVVTNLSIEKLDQIIEHVEGTAEIIESGQAD